jgi:NTE family protein
MRLAVVVGLLAMLAGCAPQVEIQNQPLLAGQSNPARALPAWPAGRPLVVLAFSGGGVRAAAMAYDTLEQLGAQPDGAGGTLLDDVAVISSVSGGSVTAAYFGLYGKAGLPDLYHKFLTQPNMWKMESQLFNPWVDLKLTLGAMGRVDAERDVFDAELFGHKTFADLQAGAGPIVLLNATDMASGDIFTFGPARFDDLCSNLASLPIATAVSASAAFPILLSPVTLRDFSAGCAGSRHTGSMGAYLAGHPQGPFVNFDQYEEALYENDLQHGKAARTDVEYIHLLDGGLADNLGVTTLGRVMTAPDKDAAVLNLFNQPNPPKKILVISVRARSFVESPLYQQEAAPGEIGMINAVTGIPLDANTSNLDDNFATLSAEVNAGLAQIAQAYGQAPPQVYYVDIDPDQLQGGDAGLRTDVEAIPTNWTLNGAQLTTIQNAVRELLVINPAFQALVAGRGAPAE